MLLNIAEVLDPSAIVAIHHEIKSGGIVFTDGSATAGWQAKAVKKNEQASGTALDGIIQKASSAMSFTAAWPSMIESRTPGTLLRMCSA